MTDGPPKPDQVGTVAEEAAKLIALLARRTAEQSPEQSPEQPPERYPKGTADTGDGQAYAGRSPAADPPSPAVDADDTCREHPRAGEALTCALCPICQGIAVLRTLQPETVDRLADLATAAAAALRELAASTAERAARNGAQPTGSRGPHGADRQARSRTVGIEVVDDEELSP